MKPAQVLLALAAVALIPACDTPPLPVEDTSVLTAILVDPSPATSVEVGDVAVFTASALYSDGSLRTALVTWTSSDPAVAAADLVLPTEPGAFFAATTGTSVITATSTTDPLLFASSTLTVALKDPPAPTITTTTLPAGHEMEFYSVPLLYANGMDAPTWTIVTGSLPPGITLDPSTGVLSGTPLAFDAYRFTVQIADSGGRDTQTYWLFTYPGPS